MADLITTKATFPKSGGLAVADGAVSVNAGNGLHVNPSTGMVEVPVDTAAGLGYGSNGMEVKVDGSTIDFNSTGQLTALGGGGGGISCFAGVIEHDGIGTNFGNFTAHSHESQDMFAAFLYGDDWALLTGCWRDNPVYTSYNLISLFNNAKDVAPKVNGCQTTGNDIIFGAGIYSRGDDSPQTVRMTANYTGHDGGAFIKSYNTVSYDTFNMPILFTWNS